MTQKQIREIGKVMANKVSIVNFTKDDEEWKDNIRKNPIFSELKGMEMALNILGIDFDYEFNDEVTKITALTVGGERFLIA